MRNQRTFSLEFKRQVVEELLGGDSHPAQTCRRYNISSSLLCPWKKQYSRGKFNNESTEEAALKDRMEKLERLVWESDLPLVLFTTRTRECSMPQVDYMAEVKSHGLLVSMAQAGNPEALLAERERKLKAAATRRKEVNSLTDLTETKVGVYHSIRVNLSEND